MLVFEEIPSFRQFISEQKSNIGFVPTMGALHKGHLSLVKKAKEENDLVVASIFVNPLQFNDSSDLNKYPRTLLKDKELLETQACDVLFLPNEKSLYQNKPVLSFDFGSLELVMEGKNRPGHFNGVAIIVSKLFNIVKPCKAYFGQKDWQQFVIINQLINDLSFDIKLISCPIIREENGLAMSSRNERLSKEERKKAGLIFQALQQAKKEHENKRPLSLIKQGIEKFFFTEEEINLEYFEIAKAYSLSPAKENEENSKLVFCIAVRIGETRLIDNILVN